MKNDDDDNETTLSLPDEPKVEKFYETFSTQKPKSDPSKEEE